MLVAIPTVTLALAALFYWTLDRPQLAGITLMVGFVAGLVYGLGSVGADVRPKDATRAGSIDFGNRD